MQCPKCQKEINNDFAICPYCGESIKEANSSSKDVIQINISKTSSKKSKIILLSLLIVLLVCIIVGTLSQSNVFKKSNSNNAITNNTSESITSPTEATTESTTIASESKYPTEQEIVTKINKAYEEMFTAAGYAPYVTFKEYKGKSPVYAVCTSIGGKVIENGEIILGSPIDPSDKDYGRIAAIVSKIDMSAMQYSSDNSLGCIGMALVPVYAMIKYQDYNGSFFNDFIQSLYVYKETSNSYVYKMQGYDIMAINNKYQLKSCAAYGKDNCDLLESTVEAY